MRAIDLCPYDSGLTTSGGDGARAFDVRASLVSLLFVGTFPLRELITRDALARDIEQSDQPVALLTDAEYQWILKALDAAADHLRARHYTEFLRRIYDAPLVEGTRRGLHAV